MKIAECKVELIDCMGSDINVVNAARVSFKKESYPLFDEDDPSIEYLEEKDKKLLNYLAKHNHWSPFAHVFASFRIKAPIFIARQLAKHQVGLAWNEVSRRYVDEEPEFFFPKQWRLKADHIKQGSQGIFPNEQPDYDLNVWTKLCTANMLCLYNEVIKDGLCPEQARMFLPQNMMTEWIWSGSVAAFSRICKLRLDSHTQKETQTIAKLISNELAIRFPNVWEVLENNE